ncbi:MAG: response regulator [Archangium sp.]|nr:response regulator [Archangium sp.]
MQTTAQVLKALFAQGRHVTDASGVFGHGLSALVALPGVTRAAVFLHQVATPQQVRLRAGHGFSTEALDALNGTTTLAPGLCASSVPLSARAEQVTVVCDGQTEPETLLMVATFLALVLERDQALSETLRLGELFSAGPVVVFRWRNTAGWPVEYVSSNVTRELGYPLEQLLEQPFAPLLHPEDLQRVATEVEEALSRGVEYFAQQYRMFDGRAELREVFDFTHVIRDAAGVVTHFHGYVFDDGEQARTLRAKNDLMGRQQQSHKLQAMGTLASGIAHDFNNVLAAILAHLELARLDPSMAENADLVAAMQSAMRGRDIVRQLLVFGRGRPEERVPHRLQRIIEDSMGMMRSTMPGSIGLRFSLDPRTPSVLADPTQLQQVLVNLVTLVAQAMPRSGTVDITLSVRPGTPPGAELAVKSEGETREREERGLGLSVVRTIIKTHGGTLELTRAGAVVLLPGVVETNGLGGPLENASGKAPRIALVDDEPLVARATERLVAQFGYQVTTFTSADEVLRAFDAKADAFELVLTDQAMPELTGLELTHALRAKGIRVPVLLVTGLPKEIDVPSVVPPFSVLGKPYRSEELANALAELLRHSSVFPLP